jgi:decaprenylphospho-beta-D-ribofuranose 2-oxidase
VPASKTVSKKKNIRVDSLQELRGWSRTTTTRCSIEIPGSPEDVRRALLDAARGGRSISIRAAGRSYGDTALNSGGVVLDLTALRRIVDFDTTTGIMTVEAE